MEESKKKGVHGLIKTSSDEGKKRKVERRNIAAGVN